MIAVNVGGKHIVFTVYGEDDNPGWSGMADELIDSFSFEPLDTPVGSPTAS